MGCIPSKDQKDTANSNMGNAAAKNQSKPGFRDPSIMVQKVATTAKTTTAAANHHVRNIFATPFELLDFQGYRPPSHPKNDAEAKLIHEALKKNFVFEHLTPKELKPLVLAFEKEEVAADTVIIKQGEEGNYFYIIETGTCSFVVDGKEVGRAKAGDSFGELALLYNSPRAATVQAVETTHLFRVDQKTFRYILQSQTKEGSEEKIKLLVGVPFLKDLGDVDISKLSNVMTPKRFSKGDYLFRKGDEADYFYILQEGTLKACNINVGSAKYEDITIGPGGYAGERAIMTGERRAGDLVAETDGLAFGIDKKTFAEVLGNLQDLIARAQDKTRLTGIKVFQDSELDSKVMTELAKLLVDKTFKAGTTITEEGKPTEAALYLVRSGKIEVSSKSGATVYHEGGGYVGAEQLLADVKSGKNGPKDPTTINAPSTVVAKVDTVCAVLTLRSCRTIVNTIHLGTPHKDILASVSSDIKMSDLKRHTILGAGTFGQVWLVSAVDKKGERHPYALKVQSKYELVQDGQAKAVIYEKMIMAKMNHPFLIQLVNTYQDDNFVYMLLGLVQGGELYSVIHPPNTVVSRHGLSEKDARFYAAGIAEGLGYMHRRGYVYRDLKPENVLIDKDGYTVIVDFGFAKYVTDKTYTLCGTPLYLPPEVILNKGHNWGADHWSLGVIVYELCTGDTPFYKEGMEQMDLFRAIVRGKYVQPKKMSPECASLVQGFLTKEPSKRLGSLKGGEDDIMRHEFFAPIDFEMLRQKEIHAPKVPKIKNPLDASNFDDWSHLEDKTKKKFPKLKPDQEKIFDGF